ncbi:MAG: glycoside hydrolase family 88 protein [Clostridia bacterium]|nr:glycoside hydrolase family 88 protein [Clostridia bacterium]
MSILIIILLLIVLVILGFDFLDTALNWFGRIKIGTITDDNEWKKTTEKVIEKWLDSGTPKVPINENKRLKLVSGIKNIGKVESTAYWQDAAVLKAAAAVGNMDEGAFVLLDRYIDTDNGEWKIKPERIDSAMLAYELLCCDYIDNDLIRPAMDCVASFLEALYNEYGTVPYNVNASDVRFVDTVGMICPFLMKYAVVYNEPRFVDIAIDQIKEYRKYGFDKETKIPCHCFNVQTKAPLGIYGWGRGCAWWAIGITDSLKTLMESKTYNIEKVMLLKYCVEFITVMKKYQREDGAFTRIIFTQSLEDSSAGAMLAYCFAYVSKLAESDELEDCCKKTLRHLKTCTRRNGVIDYAQGDTMGIGFYSDSLRVVPAAQGFAVAAIKEIDF